MHFGVFDNTSDLEFNVHSRKSIKAFSKPTPFSESAYYFYNLRIADFNFQN